jgi:hypothetical protein
MTPFNSVLLIIVGVVGYMMIIDENIATYLTLVFKIMKVNTERFFWMVKYHPNNFITTWIQNRKYDQIARELEKEFQTQVERSRD